jgi:hypothetical protein
VRPEKTTIRRLVACLITLCWGLVPAAGRGDVVRLKDGSTLHGRVLALVSDTLVVRTTFGARIQVHRSQVELVSFTDSLPAPPAMGAARPTTPVGSAGEGLGTIAVTFKDQKLSSKIDFRPHRNEEERRRANWIEQALLIDGRQVYSRMDTTMDKTIYNGPERRYKNTIELEDFSVRVAAGLHHAVLIVRNVGIDDYPDAFDGDPLDVALPLDNLRVDADRTYRVRVGIERGRFRMGKPTLYRLE